MMRSKILKLLVGGFAVVMVVICFAQSTAAQHRRPAKHASVCGNPTVPCKTSLTFEPYDLPFRVPKDAIIYDTELFYAVILKSVKADDSDCNIFIAENERLQAQLLFTDHKVFTSRCPDVETKAYTNIRSNTRFMAVYAGTTLAEANRMLSAVKATGKFSGANVRRMRTGFNGT
jgi:hypothetical protein